MQETPNLKLKKPDLTDYVNIGDLNDNADLIDAHAGEAATTLKAGHVQLSSAVTSTDDTKAATPAAVKKVNDALTTHSADGKAHGIGDKALLKTTDKTSLVGAINEAFTSASNGKSAVSAAITGVDPAVVIPPEPTFPQLATAISQISTGKKWASGIVAIPPATYIYNQFGGGYLSFGDIDVAGLEFLPSLILVMGGPGYGFSRSVIYSKQNSAYFPMINGQTVYRMDFSGRVSVLNGSFKLPFYENENAYWIAYE